MKKKKNLISLIPEQPPVSSQMIGERIMFWKDWEGRISIHHAVTGFVFQTQTEVWMEKIRNTFLPYNVTLFAVLSPNHSLTITQAQVTDSKKVLSWDDMAYLAIEMDFDVAPRELCELERA